MTEAHQGFEAHVARLWEWIDEHASKEALLKDSDGTMRSLQRLVSDLFPGIAVEVAGQETAGRLTLALVFTAFANPEKAQIVRSIVASAPPGLHLPVKAFRPPVDRVEGLIFRGVTLADFLVRFSPAREGYRLDVFVDEWPLSSKRGESVWMLIQLALGEESILEHIRQVRVHPQNGCRAGEEADQSDEGAMCGTRIREAFSAIATARRTWSH